MGSDSDLPKMRDAVEVLEELEIPCEVIILSAHRAPEATARYASEAAERDLMVIISAAGMAAHSPLHCLKRENGPGCSGQIQQTGRTRC
jgi:5-(carboxyamino)imidazole ribonucleotide mutase